MRFPEGRNRALTLSYDDGVESDARLIEIMQKNGLKGTFNLNSDIFAPEGKTYEAGTIHRRFSRSLALECYRDSGMEVAVHGARHPFWEQQPSANAVWDIISDRQALETMFGRLVRGAAYPMGTFSKEVVEILRQCGIAYCRTTLSTHSFGLPTDDCLSMPTEWRLWHPTCHHNDARLMELAERFLQEKTVYKPLLFYVWGHSYEFDRDNNWDVMEKFAAYVGNRENVWYATNIEIHDYMEAFSRLQSSVDLTRFYNPTVTPLWFEVSGKIHCLLPGETLVIEK
jgi:peptidoglycan/xylan/chitin deacetylase (PgdA/CDA1 family)